MPPTTRGCLLGDDSAGPWVSTRKIGFLWLGALLALTLILVLLFAYSGRRDVHGATLSMRPTSTDAFLEKAEELVAAHAIDTQRGQNVPIVRPPAGAELYMIGRLWAWWPSYELQAGERYQLHLTSADVQHAFAIAGEEIDVPVLPGFESVVLLEPRSPGRLQITCSFYCGVGHEAMIGQIVVRPRSEPTGNARPVR